MVEENPGGHSSASSTVRFLSGAQIQALSQAPQGRAFSGCTGLEGQRASALFVCSSPLLQEEAGASGVLGVGGAVLAEVGCEGGVPPGAGDLV